MHVWVKGREKTLDAILFATLEYLHYRVDLGLVLRQTHMLYINMEGAYIHT